MNMKPYWSAFRIRALLETQYRGAALGGLVTQFFFGLVLCSLYRALYAGSDPRALQETVTYVWMQQMLMRMVMSTDGELNQQILTGGIAYTLVRPVDQHLWWTCRDLAIKLIGSLMRMLPMLLVVMLLPDEYRMLPPDSPLALVQFLLSLCLGLLCFSQISSICQAVTMITLDSRGISGMIHLIKYILCGNIIPLTLFPDRLQTLIRYQPFAQGLDAPLRMYLQQQSAGEFLLNTGVQLLWLVGMTLLARWMWRRHLDRLVIQGG